MLEFCPTFYAMRGFQKREIHMLMMVHMTYHMHFTHLHMLREFDDMSCTETNMAFLVTSCNACFRVDDTVNTKTSLCKRIGFERTNPIAFLLFITQLFLKAHKKQVIVNFLPL